MGFQHESKYITERKEIRHCYFSQDDLLDLNYLKKNRINLIFILGLGIK